MKLKITSFLMLAILFCIIPCHKASALKPPRIDKYEYSGPQDFVHWINNKSMAKSKSFFEESMYQKYVNTYKEDQDYILAPKIAGAALDRVYWKTSEVPINYKFSNKNIDWYMVVYPVQAYNKEHFPSDITSDLERRYRIVCDVSDDNSHLVTDSITGEEYMQRQSMEKTKLKLAGTTVDCLQEVWRWKNEKTTLEEVFWDFITEGMYVQVYAHGMTANKLNYMTQIMSKCSFRKFYTNPGLKINGKKNKVSRKNAILYATLHNPARGRVTKLRLYLYDKAGKKHKVLYREDVKKRYRRRRKLTIKLDVRQCLKKAKRQMKAKNIYTLQRKKKYRYKIQVKVGTKYCNAFGSFKLR